MNVISCLYTAYSLIKQIDYFLFYIVIADPRITTNEKYIEQIGRIYRFVIPCVYLCSITITAE